jgi:hypothetical protein
LSTSWCLQEAASAAEVPLPLELLSHVLRHVALHDRLGPCSLVCKAWQAAAAAATHSVNMRLRTRGNRPDRIYQVESLKQWLCKHGGAVTHLSIWENHT